MKKIFAPLVAVAMMLATTFAPVVSFARGCAVAIGRTVHDGITAHMQRAGLIAYMATPTAADFQAARVTNPGQSEVISQRLYDYQLLAGAGSQQLSFFQQPIGQGVTTALGGVVGSAKTQWDTNMSLGGQLPSGMQYLVESIEVKFWPGSVSTANTFTPATASIFAAVAAAALVQPADDVLKFYQSGMLELNVLQKNYVRETPLDCFAPKARVETNGQIASNSATTSTIGQSITNAVGRPYYVEPRVLLQPAMNFELLLKWPAAVAAPSGFNARVGVILDGYLMRSSQ